MSLRRYAAKRDFARTPEPPPRPGKRRAAGRAAPLSFVVQKHDASRLHYDVRLELGGALLSWAVPKGPSLNPAHRRLAVRTEDHPLEYGAFEGVIPEGEYGGGTVMLWDRGTWEPADDHPAAALRNGKLSFTLRGERLGGAWTLARTGGSDDEEKENWLLLKKRDDAARTGDDALPERFALSVASGRSMEQIARSGKVWRSDRAAPEKPPPRAGARRATARAAPPTPDDLRPQLCTLVGRTPPGDGWLHEVKFDGYRLLVRKRGDDVRLITRAGHDWTDRFPPIARAAARLDADDAVLDGEAVIVNNDGTTSFQRLQGAIKARDFGDLAFFAFDLLWLSGRDLRHEPLADRKAALQELLRRSAAPPLRFSEHIAGHSEEVHREACRAGLEGVVSKRADAPYTSGRSRSWVKVKCHRRQEFVVVGWTPPSGSRTAFGALLLGAHDADGRLVYTGRVGTGFDEATLRDLAGRLKTLRVRECPLHAPPSAAERRGAVWVKPVLVAEVEFTEWTDSGRLRHPSYQGLREDKPAAEVRIESPAREPVAALRAAASPLPPPAPAEDAPAPRPARKPTAGSRRGRGKARSIVVAGVTITNADRVLFAPDGLTKGDVARHYERVARWIMPFLAGRPLSTVRCTSQSTGGGPGTCFYQKHRTDMLPDPVRSVPAPEDDGVRDYIGVDSAEGLLTLVQFGVIEIHPWGARAPDLERPDTLIFDLDPGEGFPFGELKAAASALRERLHAEGLATFLKTSGGKGLHIYAPLEPAAGWDEVKAFAKAVAEDMERERPDLFLTNMRKAMRSGKCFIDYLRNGRGATCVAPYALRARARGPISLPIPWDTLGALDRADGVTLAEAAGLFARWRDPWEGFFERAGRIGGRAKRRPAKGRPRARRQASA